jgi:biotin carboxyl carrier protein
VSSETFRLSGKKLKLPTPARDWKFEARSGGWVIAQAPDGTRLRFQLHELRGKLSASLSGQLVHGEISQESRGSGAGSGSDSDLIAQFPGKVRKLLVKEGQAVADGEPLVLVEAMKMEFAVKSPFAGKVKKILVKEGQQLSPGDRLIDVEASGGK